jgi:hypothetical protein
MGLECSGLGMAGRAATVHSVGSVRYAAGRRTRTDPARPGLREALAAVRSGDTFVVTKLDRLARSLRDAREIADELTGKGVALSLGGSRKTEGQAAETAEDAESAALQGARPRRVHPDRDRGAVQRVARHRLSRGSAGEAHPSGRAPACSSARRRSRSRAKSCARGPEPRARCDTASTRRVAVTTGRTVRRTPSSCR